MSLGNDRLEKEVFLVWPIEVGVQERVGSVAEQSQRDEQVGQSECLIGLLLFRIGEV